MKSKEPTKDQEDNDVQLNNKYLDLNEIKVNLEDKKKFNPQDLAYLTSETSWQDLKLDKGLIDVLVTKGFKRPSVVQKKVIVLSNKNSVLAQSQNGSGKTLAYLIPCMRELVPATKGTDEYSKPAPQIIIVGDTKALILQVHKILRDILDAYEGYQDVTMDYLFGGKKDLSNDIQIFICTIAQLKKCISKKWISVSKIKMLAIDEADHVFESDLGKNFFGVFINKILKTNDFKIIFTSATMTEDFLKVAEKVKEKRNLLSFDLPVEQLTLKNVYQFMIKYKNHEQKLQVLDTIIQNLDAQNILIFGNNKRILESLQEHLSSKNYKVAFVYNSKSNMNVADFLQQQINDFLAGKYRILLTTNLLSRGIDMRKVTLVINYSLPLKYKIDKSDNAREVDLETYLHRVGRTGRFGDHGIALNLVDGKRDQVLIQSIQDHYKNEIKEINLDKLSNVNDILKKITEVNKDKREFLEENI